MTIQYQIESRQALGEILKNRWKRLTKERQTCFRKKQNNNNNTNKRIKVNDINNEIVHHKLGRIDQIGIYYDVKLWRGEKNRDSRLISLTFAICYIHGKVQLLSLIKLPSYLLNLYILSQPNIIIFYQNLRCYNSLLACILFGANINQF